MSRVTVKSFWLFSKFHEIRKSLLSVFRFAHLEKFSDRLVVEQKLLSIRLVAAVVYVLVEVPLQAQKRLADHTRVVRVELDAFD